LNLIIITIDMLRADHPGCYYTYDIQSTAPGTRASESFRNALVLQAPSFEALETAAPAPLR